MASEVSNITFKKGVWLEGKYPCFSLKIFNSEFADSLWIDLNSKFSHSRTYLEPRIKFWTIRIVKKIASSEGDWVQELSQELIARLPEYKEVLQKHFTNN